MKIYNTLAKKKEEFKPLDQNKVRMFVCGPTVYDLMHIGNARTFVFFDVVGRYLEYKGFKLNYIQNITDIDDKIIERAHQEGQTPRELALHYRNEFIKDVGDIKIIAVNNYASATDHITEVINQVKKLKELGHAYLIEGDGWYFDLKTFPEYGKLSGRTAEMADDAVSRIDINDKKRNRGDFCLWKLTQIGDPTWDFETSEYLGINDGRPAFAKASAGRPGWHIEDTAITEKYFGPQYDIHGGGQDLMFPHHEAEIAQQESASGLKPFVRYWMHAGFIVNRDAKMSKSVGNFRTLRELFSSVVDHPAETLRLYFLSAHYRSPLAYEDALIKQAGVAVDRIADFLARLSKANADENPIVDEILKSKSEKFLTGMDDDFNAPAAIAAVFELVRALNPFVSKNLISASQAETILAFFKTTVERILGIVPEPKEQSIPPEILELAEQREQHRADQDWQKADTLRSRIESAGYTIDDTPYGPLISSRD